MPDNPFANPAFAALGGQMAQMWQSTLESWWKALLGDGARLGELARKLSEAGLGGGGGEPGARAEDIGRVIDALELMEARMRRLEDQSQELATNLAAVVGYLEALTSAAGGAGPGVAGVAGDAAPGGEAAKGGGTDGAPVKGGA